MQLGSLTAVGDVDSQLVAGKPVRFTLAVRSRQGSACAFAPVLSLVVTSGSDRIWTSADCPVTAVGGPGVTAAPDLAGTARTVLVPGGVLLGTPTSATLDLVWPGVRSAGSCSAAAGSLEPGTYVASVEVPDAGSTGTAFTLS